MEERKQQIDKFFNHYCSTFNTAISEKRVDAEATAILFTDCFIAADPSGVNCGKNDHNFREVMLKGYEFYKTIGITSMEIIKKEITPLDETHTMTKIYWKSYFTKKDGSKADVEFTNIYFTQSRENQHKVFAYITGDEQTALKNIGLI